jgi:hypothetical protein
MRMIWCGSVSIIVVFCLCLIGLSLQDNAMTGNLKSNEELEYINISNSIWTHYQEDLYYSSFVLDRYTNGNITAEDAFTATVSAFEVCTQTSSFLQEISPPMKYQYLHNLTALAVLSLQTYLWNLAKYYETTSIESWSRTKYKETGNGNYISQAEHYRAAKNQYYIATHNYFNETVYYMDLAKKERFKAIEF